MITVTVTGHGNFAIPSTKADELISWLRSNSTPMESSNKVPEGQTLLNESDNNPYPAGSPQYYLHNIRDIHGN
jgi:hypothetical protein